MASRAKFLFGVVCRNGLSDVLSVARPQRERGEGAFRGGPLSWSPRGGFLRCPLRWRWAWRPRSPLHVVGGHPQTPNHGGLKAAERV